MALLSGVAAKEIVVSTIGVLYAGGDPQSPDEIDNLAVRLRTSGDFTRASAVAFLVFMLIYFPCLATVAAIRHEAGWRWAAASIVYNTLLAWIVAFVAYHFTAWLL